MLSGTNILISFILVIFAQDERRRFKNKSHRTSQKTCELGILKYFVERKVTKENVPLSNAFSPMGSKWTKMCLPYSCAKRTPCLRDPKSGHCHQLCLNYISNRLLWVALRIKTTIHRIVSKGITLQIPNTNYKLFLIDYSQIRSQ